MSSLLTDRDERIDALRGFALLGILLVNIQSFLWGGVNPAGYLRDDSTALDHVLFFLTVTFVNLKFMPLFAMLFGAGFALLLDKLATRTTAPHAVYRRRLAFLFVFGILHGVFLYYGDITHMYAIAGLVLLHYAARDRLALRRAVAWWSIGAMTAAVLVLVLLADSVPGPLEVETELRSNFAIFTTMDYADQFSTRLSLFFDIVTANIVGLPLTVALMLAGMLAQRSGWLADRISPAWRRATLFGVAVGLPAALMYGALLYAEADAHGLGAFSLIATAPGLVSVVLAVAYAAQFLTRAPNGLVRWLAPAGRMPLTNYLLQSVAMGGLLSGWGLGLGAALGYSEAVALAVAIFVAQLALSRWWLQHQAQGPLEALWRRWTYWRMPPLRADVRTAE